MVVLSNFPPPAEGIKHEQNSTTVLINEREIGKGTLFIAESRLSWVNNLSGTGFSLEYPHIAIHAVSRDLQTHPQECLYVMVDSNIDESDNRQQESNSGDEDSDPQMTEIRFVPDDKTVLDAMFQAMNACQALHPDPTDSISEEEDEDIYEDADEDTGYFEEGVDAPVIPVGGYEGTTNGNNPMGEPMEMEAEQFDDADGEDI